MIRKVHMERRFSHLHQIIERDQCHHARQDPLGPRTVRLLAANIEVADPAHIRRNHIEPAVVITDRRGVNSSRLVTK